MAIRVETLGGVRVVQDGGELVKLPRQPLRCALLVYLAIERKATRVRLAELFWPERPSDRARRMLSQMLYELRQSLGTDWVDTSIDRLVADERLTTDVGDMLRSVERGDTSRATAAYRGRFMGGFTLADAPAFSRWVEDQRVRLAAIYREAQLANVDRLVAAGEAPRALAAARRWVLADPLDDEAQQRLIGLLARGGLRNEALRQYDDYRDRLAAIDAEPLPSIAALVDELKSGSLPLEVSDDVAMHSGQQLEASTGVVVFPIVNLAEDDAKQYFCDGLAEEIMNVLGRIPGLRVVPRTSAFAFVNPGVRVGAVVRELGVSHALKGSVRFAEDRYRIRIALIEGATEAELWQDQFQGALGSQDVFDLQDQIAGKVFEALGERLGLHVDEDAREARPAHPSRGDLRGETRDPEAHALFLRGRHAWFGRSIPDLEQALHLFQLATRADPAYARAHAGIADVHLVLGGLDYATRPPKDLYAMAKEATDTALELDPDLAEAHAAMGNYLMSFAWDWEGAGDRFRTAISLNPGYSTARQWYSNYLMSLGHEDEAVAEATLALELDPRSAFLSSTLARHYQLMRQPERAAEQFRHALELAPHLASARIALALAELQSGHIDLCLSIVQAVADRTERDIPLLLGLHAYACAAAGDQTQALRLVQRLKATPAPYLPPEYVAFGYIGLGDYERSLDWLERALEARSPTLTLLKVEPLFDPLRGHPRFMGLLEQVGLLKD
jgi:TolB-like protein/Tfp pilus assembly protein PilF